MLCGPEADPVADSGLRSPLRALIPSPCWHHRGEFWIASQRCWPRASI